MAITTRDVVNSLTSLVATDLTPGEVAQTAKTGAHTLYAIALDNRDNAYASFAKLYDAAAPVVGTTDPDVILGAFPNQRRIVVATRGIAFATASKEAVVSTGGTGGVVPPANDAPLTLHIG